MLPEDESFSENDTVSGSPPTDSAPKSHPGDRTGKGRDEKRGTGSSVRRSVSTVISRAPDIRYLI